MPLPTAPTKKPKLRPASKADKDLLLRGGLCVLIGLAVLIAPYFAKAPSVQSVLLQSAVIGWFALVLGIGYSVAYVQRRFSSKAFRA